MKETINLLKVILSTIVVISLYLAAAYSTFEFLYFLMEGSLSNNSIITVMAIATGYYLLSMYIKKKNTTKFINTFVSKLLSVFLAIALSISSLLLIQAGFRDQYNVLLLELYSNVDIYVVGEFVRYGFGLFLLVTILVLILIEKSQNNNGNKYLYYSLIGFVILLSLFAFTGISGDGISSGFFSNVLKPSMIWLIGPLSIGWFFELFIESIEVKQENIQLDKVKEIN